MHLKTVGLLLLFVFAACTPPATRAVGWRSDGDGRDLEANPPLHWSEDNNVAWKTPMPSWSNASPVLATAGPLLFVCSEPDQVLGIDRTNGMIVWQHSVISSDVASEVQTHDANGYTSPTPVSDGKNVFTVFGSGMVAAHTLAGEPVWARLVQQPVHGWGHSASPVFGGDLLIVHLVDLIGLDPATGKELWRVPSAVKFGSPVVVEIGDTDVVITPSGDVFRAADGVALAIGIGHLEYATPVVQEGIIYFIEKKATAVQLPANLDEPFASTQLWQAHVEGSRLYASSLIHDGLVYAISREESFSVLDAVTGEIVYEHQFDLGEGGNSAYPSITLAGDKLFVSAQSGATAVLQPGRTFRELARNKVEGFRSSLVSEGTRMYVRAFDYLYCFEQKN
jgi:outer membrane protein assembly factor BamB